MFLPDYYKLCIWTKYSEYNNNVVRSSVLQHNIWVGLHAAYFGQVFSTFGQLKFGATSLIGQVYIKKKKKKVNI
jgi:hypothetical protein